MSLLALDTIGGLPAHPLLVHIPVVLVPVTAVLAFYQVAQVGHSGAKASWDGVHVVSGQGD